MVHHQQEKDRSISDTTPAFSTTEDLLPTWHPEHFQLPHCSYQPARHTTQAQEVAYGAPLPISKCLRVTKNAKSKENVSFTPDVIVVGDIKVMPESSKPL